MSEGIGAAPPASANCPSRSLQDTAGSCERVRVAGLAILLVAVALAGCTGPPSDQRLEAGHTVEVGGWAIHSLRLQGKFLPHGGADCWAGCGPLFTPWVNGVVLLQNRSATQPLRAALVTDTGSGASAGPEKDWTSMAMPTGELDRAVADLAGGSPLNVSTRSPDGVFLAIEFRAGDATVRMPLDARGSDAPPARIAPPRLEELGRPFRHGDVELTVCAAWKDARELHLNVTLRNLGASPIDPADVLFLVTNGRGGWAGGANVPYVAQPAIGPGQSGTFLDASVFEDRLGFPEDAQPGLEVTAYPRITTRGAGTVDDGAADTPLRVPGPAATMPPCPRAA